MHEDPCTTLGSMISLGSMTHTLGYLIALGPMSLSLDVVHCMDFCAYMGDVDMVITHLDGAICTYGGGC